MSKYCLTTVKTHRENSRASKGSSQGFPQVKQGEQESVNWPSWCHIWDHLVGNLNAQPRIVTSTSFHIISSAVTPSEQQIFPARVSFAGELIREFTWKDFPEPLDHGARASFPHLPAAALLLLLIRDIGIISCLPPASFWLQMRFVLPRIKKKQHKNNYYWWISLKLCLLYFVLPTAIRFVSEEIEDVLQGV